MSSVGSFFKGFFVPFQGFFWIFTSLPLFLLAAIPFWLAIVVAVYVIYFLWNESGALLQFFLTWMPGFASFIDLVKVGEFSLFAALYQGLFWIFLVLFTFYFSYLVLCILGAPFYSLIADRILVKKGVAPVFKNNFFRWLYTTLKMFIISCIKLVVFMTISAILFILSFWSFAVIFVPLLICLMMAYDCIDFSFECMNYSLSQRWRIFRVQWPFFLGLASIILFFSFIPGLFTISLPLFIAGGAEAIADMKNQGVV